MSIEKVGVEARLAARTHIHSALSDPHRLAIVDELTLSDRSPRELERMLLIGSNLLAHHLRVLEEAGLVERISSSADRRSKYLHLLHEPLDQLGVSAPLLSARHVLFVCTGNSARSQLAEAVWNQTSPVPAQSAGTRPAQEVHPGAVAAAAKAGFDLARARPRSVGEVANSPQLVITVCDVARAELGDLPSDVTWLHWSIPDPAPIGTAPAFNQALSEVRARVLSLAPHVQLPPGSRRSRR
jgi:ArsR family transcriptional regulator, arsenate/arsenite/antimonite-responsive transcriptional repressor / arsenate reductase (thioredoxin)